MTQINNEFPTAKSARSAGKSGKLFAIEDFV